MVIILGVSLNLEKKNCVSRGIEARFSGHEHKNIRMSKKELLAFRLDLPHRQVAAVRKQRTSPKSGELCYQVSQPSSASPPLCLGPYCSLTVVQKIFRTVPPCLSSIFSGLGERSVFELRPRCLRRPTPPSKEGVHHRDRTGITCHLYTLRKFLQG